MAHVPASASLREMLKPFQNPTLWRSIMELLLTAAPLAALWTAGAFAAAFGLWWLALLISIPAAAFVVRLFMVQHDCGHRSFFRSAWANDWVGRVIGIVTLTPHDCWRRTHGIHHATSGNLDRRELGAVRTVSVKEYEAMTPGQRFGYRLYRNPVVLFVIGPFYVFFLQQRLPHGIMKEGWRPWVSAMGTNVALAAIMGAAIWMGGLNILLLVWLPTMLLAAMIGVWLFFVQHQFEETYWARNENWELVEAAMRGSSHYDLPPVLRWLTGNIGIHHIHHVSSRIPFYKLREVLKKNPALKDVNRLSLLASIRCAGLALWDEAGQRLVSFGHHARMKSAREPTAA